MTLRWPDDAASAAVLERAAKAARLLVALDFDGTLAPLHDEPMLTRAMPESVAAVAALVDVPATTVAYVSGRSLPDLRIIAEHDDRSRVLIGASHGAEFWYPADGAQTRDADQGQGQGQDQDQDAEEIGLRDELRAAAASATADLDGVWIEPKSFGFGVHTRRASADAARRAYGITDALIAEHAPHWRRRSGHNIIEYSYRHEGKDAAIATLRGHTGATCVLFAGDDVTDEDALRALGPGDVGVRVGEAETAAAVRVADIQDLARLLSELARLRVAARP